MSERQQERQPESDRARIRRYGYCDECGALAQLIRVYASHSADVIARLCEKCNDGRLLQLEILYRGD